MTTYGLMIGARPGATCFEKAFDSVDILCPAFHPWIWASQVWARD